MRVLWISRYKGNLNGYRPEGEILIDLKRAGVDIDFMGFGDESYLARIREHDINIIPFVTPNRKVDVSAIRAIRGQLKTKQYDVAMAFQGKSVAALMMAAIGLQVKTVAYRGQTGNIYKYDPTSYLTMLHPRLDGIVCVAKAIEDDLHLRVWSKTRPKITTIYKGHDVNWYSRKPVDLGERLGIPADAFVLGFAANVRPRKGLPVLLEAAKYLPAEANIHILLMGSGTDGEAVKDKAVATGHGTNIHCLGFRKDVIELISSCDATVLPTLKREGFSRSIVESMALEIPVIASDTGGNAELVKNGETGLVVPPGDPQALANAISTMANDRQGVAEMGKRSRVRIKEYFDHEQAVVGYRAFFEEMVEQ
jgi:glycosyltransferase involved in cell wall biosynthesis